MIITIAQDEIAMLQVLTNNAQSLQNALQQALSARKVGISLLEKKYDAVFNEQTGQFEELPNTK